MLARSSIVDIASAIGFVLGMGLVLVTIIMGSPLSAFFNVPGLAIVVGGTFATVFMAEGIKQVIGAGKVGAQAFFGSAPNVNETIAKIAELAVVVRKEGLLALENQEINDPFLAKGVRLAVDGIPPEEVEATLAGEMATMKDRHKRGSQLYEFAGANAPAMGMIGTLVGLVQMLSNMDDPKSIGPAMAVALLTTLYGAMIANMVALPIADKCKTRANEEARVKSMIIDALVAIQAGQNPRVIQSLLKAYLAEGKRGSDDDDG